MTGKKCLSIDRWESAYLAKRAMQAWPGSTPVADYAYYTPDHLGSVRGIRLEDRGLSGSHAYEPHGQIRAASGIRLNSQVDSE
jgi:hypothetical protein